jgi:branched-chain amino acid transport system substrate-binding protein
MNMKGKALLAGCIALIMSSAAMAEDIKVAVVGAMSGPVAQYGDQEFTGAEQAIADINAKGGIKGNKLQMVKYDDACDPKQAVAVANKVINDGIKYVIGHLCSSSTQPASDIYEDEGVLMITPAATAPELTARGYHLILRTTGLDSDQGPTAAKYILEKVKPQRIAIVHDKQQYGEGLARSVQENLKKGGANVVFFDGITAGEKDFSTLVARLKKENIDFVYYGGYHPEMGQILRQSRAAGLKTQFMGPEGSLTCRCLISRVLLRKVCWLPSRRTMIRFRRTNRSWMRSRRRNRIRAAHLCGPPMRHCNRWKRA